MVSNWRNCGIRAVEKKNGRKGIADYLFRIFRRIWGHWTWPPGSSWRPCDYAIRSSNSRRFQRGWPPPSHPEFHRALPRGRPSVATCWIASAWVAPCIGSTAIPWVSALRGDPPWRRKPPSRADYRRADVPGCADVVRASLFWRTCRLFFNCLSSLSVIHFHADPAC